MPNKAGPNKPFSEMTTQELRQATKQFDRTRLAAPKPLSPAMKARWEQARKRMGRPRVGKGAKRILITVEGGLLERLDRYVKAAGSNRSATIARGIEALLSDSKSLR
jgi:hypothetical protein